MLIADPRQNTNLWLEVLHLDSPLRYMEGTLVPKDGLNREVQTGELSVWVKKSLAIH